MNTTIAHYHPSPRICDATTWAAIAPTVRDCCTLMEPAEGNTSLRWLGVTTRYFAWCVQGGHDFSITEDKIVAHCAGLTLMPRTVQGNMARLRALGRAQGTVFPPMTIVWPSRKDGSRSIFTPEELERWWQVACHQPSPLRRRDLCTIIALGAGAGLTSAECVALSASDVEGHPHDSGILLVHLPDRVVPVDSLWVPRLHELVATCPGEYLFRQSDKVQRDLMTTVKRRVKTPAGLPGLTMRRLRSTWMVSMMSRRLTVPELYSISGVRSASVLQELAPYVPGSFDDGRYLRIAAGLEKGL